MLFWFLCITSYQGLKTNQEETPDGRIYLDTCKSLLVHTQLCSLFSLHFSQFQKEKNIFKSFSDQKCEALLPHYSLLYHSYFLKQKVHHLDWWYSGRPTHRVDGCLKSHLGLIIVSVLCTKVSATPLGIQAVNEFILEAFPARMLTVHSPRETVSGTLCTVLIRLFQKRKDQIPQVHNRANQRNGKSALQEGTWRPPSV